MLRRNFISQFMMLVGSGMLRASSVKAEPQIAPEAAKQIASAADEFLQALQPESRKQLEFSFDDAERFKWSNVPNAVFPRRGLAFGKMSDSEKAAAHRLLQELTSNQGYLKATGIISLETVLNQAKGADIRGIFSPDFYFVSFFGRPGKDNRWAIRINGHHLALYLTVVNGEITSTPLFLGAEPATVEHGHLAGYRVLGTETMKGLALRNALSAEQAKQAVLAPELPPDIFTGPEHDKALSTFSGISASRLNAGQRQMLESLIDEYLNNMHPQIARSHRRRIQADGLSALNFAWMGSATVGKPIYYRVHGPSILIEYDNSLAVGTQTRINDPNHIHTIVRVPGNDYGEDVLRRHHRQTPHK